MRTRTSHIAAAITAVILCACNSTRWVPQGKHLLVRNQVTVDPGTLSADEIGSIIKQKPNKRVFWRSIYLDWYNLRDPVKVARKRALKDSLCEVENAARRLKNKKPKTCDHATRGRNGEAPVLLDSSMIDRSVEQIRLYAVKEGYFAARVSDTTHFTHRSILPWKGWGARPYKKPKAAVEYVVKAGRPWTICQVEHRIDDPRMADYIEQEKTNSLLRPGDRFDGDLIDEERTRIAAYLRSEGYLFFTRDMVIFDADTSAGDHQVDLLMRLERPKAQTQRGLKGTPEGTVYYLDKVIVDTRWRRASDTTMRMIWSLPTDTLSYGGATMLYQGHRPEFRPKSLMWQLFLHENDRFNQNDVDRSFRRLTNLRVFDRVDITFDTLGVRGPGLANCRVSLVRGKRQGMSIEGFGTNRGGFLGTSLNFGYRHKNIFRTMALLQTSLTFGFEAQQKLTTSTASEDASTAIGKGALFNTIEIGPEASLRIPLPWGAKKANGSRLIVSALYNYQQRPDYTRTLAKGSLGAEFFSTPTQSFALYPLELNFVSIPTRTEAFAAFLDSTNDAVLKDSYTDHVIPGFRGIYTLNTQPAGKRRNNHFFRGILESSGNISRFIGHNFGGTPLHDAYGKEYYTFTGVRFAQFIKADVDYRFYHTIHERSSLVMRATVGVGKPYGNLEVLPFEASFYSGGANGMRAWRARTLGPGSYRSPTNSFDRIGEMRLEGNVEYRFKIFGYLEGALFADAGNIWYLQPDPAKPGGDFKWDRFMSELAVGTGVGARLNFDFFLIRIDLGLQTKNPSLPMGQRWIFQEKDPEYVTSFVDKLNLNLGINYPF